MRTTPQTTLALLRHANPVTRDDAASFAEAIGLRSFVSEALAATEREPIPTGAIRGRNRRRAIYTLAGCATTTVAVAVSPAWALIRDELPFAQAPAAPTAVQIDFASLNTGAPTAGMNPQAIADQTRMALDVTADGTDHTLYLAPTAKGGFCFQWTGWWGGCDATGSSQLAWQTSLEIPAGVVATIPPPPAPGPHYVEQGDAWEQAIKQARALAVPTWIAGFVNVTGAQTIAIRFSDGTTIDTAITWISAPISAGFFSYLPADNQRTESNHVIDVEALDAQGNLVAQQPLTR